MNNMQEIKNLVGNSVLRVAADSQLEQIQFEDFAEKNLSECEFLCFYFGAHWAPPSRIFTTFLDEQFYQVVNKDKRVAEVIFVTEDREQEHFKRNFLKMPWFAVPFEDDS
mmetsp:Transcript_9730/g.16392  ORF Transcript_9730/g.16392 Transcript_9730/m.16392 type:complete len:110 (+) Transcript_9730:25-354(+)